MEINDITSKTTIQAKPFKTHTFDKSWVNYKRFTRALAIKCHSELLMSKGIRTLYYENNLILITTEGAEHVSIDDKLFDFSYEHEHKNLHGSPIVRTKFAELYQSEKERAKAQIMPDK